MTVVYALVWCCGWASFVTLCAGLFFICLSAATDMWQMWRGRFAARAVREAERVVREVARQR